MLEKLGAYEGNETILVVDDDKKILKLLSNFFDSLGYNVLTAKDGEDAVTTYKQHLYSISMVLMDIVMPGKDGITAYNEIKEINSKADILLLSGYAADYFDKVPDGDIMQKPFSLIEIVHKIRTILDKTHPEPFTPILISDSIHAL